MPNQPLWEVWRDSIVKYVNFGKVDNFVPALWALEDFITSSAVEDPALVDFHSIIILVPSMVDKFASYKLQFLVHKSSQISSPDIFRAIIGILCSFSVSSRLFVYFCDTIKDDIGRIISHVGRISEVDDSVDILEASTDILARMACFMYKAKGIRMNLPQEKWCDLIKGIDVCRATVSNCSDILQSLVESRKQLFSASVALSDIFLLSKNIKYSLNCISIFVLENWIRFCCSENCFNVYFHEVQSCTISLSKKLIDIICCLPNDRSPCEASDIRICCVVDNNLVGFSNNLSQYCSIEYLDENTTEITNSLILTASLKETDSIEKFPPNLLAELKLASFENNTKGTSTKSYSSTNCDTKSLVTRNNDIVSQYALVDGDKNHSDINFSLDTIEPIRKRSYSKCDFDVENCDVISMLISEISSLQQSKHQRKKKRLMDAAVKNNKLQIGLFIEEFAHFFFSRWEQRFGSIITEWKALDLDCRSYKLAVDSFIKRCDKETHSLENELCSIMNIRESLENNEASLKSLVAEEKEKARTSMLKKKNAMLRNIAVKRDKFSSSVTELPIWDASCRK